ncbi:TPA: hypothetical protein BOS_5624 [Bos taurus]|nr:TPA: hypothetical protein BOS_5624 [Bos taurus]
MQVSEITMATQRQLMCALTRITEAADAVDLTHEQLVTRKLARELARQEQSGQCRLACNSYGVHVDNKPCGCIFEIFHLLLPLASLPRRNLECLGNVRSSFTC